MEGPVQSRSDYIQWCRLPVPLWTTSSSEWSATQTGDSSTGTVSQVPNGEENHFPKPAGICWCSSGSCWPFSLKLVVYLDTQVVACRAAFKQFVHNLYSPSLNFMRFLSACFSSFLTCQWIAALLSISSPLFGVVGILAVGSFCLITDAINKDFKQCQPLSQALRNVTHNWTPFQDIDLHSFSGAAQLEFFTSFAVHPPSSDLPNLTTIVLWKTVSKALLKPC